MARLKAVLSDMGDILFSTAEQGRARREALHEIFQENGMGWLSADEIMRMYRPYKTIGQTILSERAGIELFFRQNAIYDFSYDDFVRIYESKKQGEPALFPGITESLEQIRGLGIPFVVVSDTTKREPEIWESLEGMIAGQLRERGLCLDSGFDVHDYVTGISSSRDVGVKKPHEKIFRHGIERAGMDLDFGDALFVAHEGNEIFGAAKLGMEVAALNYGIERDADEIRAGINEHNERFKIGQAKAYIYPIERFNDILGLVEPR